MRTDVNACDCAGGGGGGADTVRESALNVASGRKLPCRPGESNLRQRRAGPTLLPTELHPHPNIHPQQRSNYTQLARSLI